MSLTQQQVEDTKREFAANFELTGKTPAAVAADLHITTTKLERLMTLQQQSLNDPWILRNYLLQAVTAAGETPIPFTALSGDWHRHWFLDADAIDRGHMTAGDY
ncbi:DUF2316 family protein [Lacticaseibacillus pantheris]|jgi:hypothetical protein|uniref:DUF2316 domain-containing protein n=1 Tax=Lacticaseibacillus pantheris DSM 15945 = JCM 12539 = NBRC 106106 TaxID=1423783 RepID=A0A0R1U9M7_9LACO|nr:DUF2316 family protein [Lacticaseibacillus pantheris]KRL86539.1 hypothetical protein FC50_GL000788 [Lacticaseibacillus pantheris DSM 15945 = JCM 12539 = NBRC 106106]WKF84798.1 DUF2316 family protein [Lacticaseibacillus pantheris]